ncbi:MAG: TIGR03790 family protein [Syntrophotaleaceae bacterium]
MSKGSTVAICLIGLFWGVSWTCPLPAWALTADELLVVSNRAVSASGKLARYYMERRQVPKENWLRLRTTEEEHVSRDDYEKQIAAPVREFLLENDPTGERFKCIVLMYGLPLRMNRPIPTLAEAEQIKALQQRLDLLEERVALPGEGHEPQRQALQGEAQSLRQAILHQKQFHKGAAVDSELALVMEKDHPLQGWLPNRYFLGYRNHNMVDMPGRVLMVSRLDGSTPAVVRRIIDDSLAVEAEGLNGKAYFDARWAKPQGRPSSAYGRYDLAIHNTAFLLQKFGSLPVVIDDKEGLFQDGEAPQAALYSGWYSLGNYVDAFSWAKGAVGFHVASSECTTLKKKSSRVWCKSMLDKGVVATVGPVAEPYLQSFPSPEIFFGCLVAGRNPLAECYALANPFWSWQMVLIGDPLYRPFKQRPLLH